jgi:hypothetical protein
MNVEGYEYVAQLEWQTENQQRIIRGLEVDNADLRNELCLKCGLYKTAHLGSCDGCRWKKGAHE